MIRFSKPLHLATILVWSSALGILPATYATIPATASNAAGAASLTIPEPDLGSMQPAAREKIENLRRTLQRRLDSGSDDRTNLAEGFGFLGQAYHAFGLHEAAVGCYSGALELAPGEVRWLYLRGLARNSMGDFTAAFADYERVTRISPDLTVARIRLGNALLEAGRGAEARDQFESALAIASDSASAYFGLGRAHEALGDDRAAAEHFERALSLQPQADTVHYPLAQAYRRLGDESRALSHLARGGSREVAIPDPFAGGISAFTKTIAFDVIQDMAKQEEGFSDKDFLGFVLAQFAGFPAASEQLSDMLASPETLLSAVVRGRLRYALGGLLTAQGRDSEAIESFTRAVDFAPDLRDARVKLGNALARSGRFDEAVSQYDQALGADSKDVDTLVKRAAASSSAGGLPGARSDLEKALALEPGHQEARMRLASVLELGGDPAGAAASLERAIEGATSAQEKSAAHLALAKLRNRGGDPRRAALHYQRAAEADPSSPAPLYGLGGLLGQLGRFAEAAQVYSRAVTLEPESVTARMGEITALILAGSHRLARTRLEEAHGLMPDNLTFKDVLARHLAACPDLSVRDGARAVQLSRELYEALPTAESMETLAMAYSTARQFAQAVEWQEKLIEQLGDQAPTDLATRLKANLDLYKAGRPCCAGAGE